MGNPDNYDETFNFDEVGAVPMKGLAKPMMVYKLTTTTKQPSLENTPIKESRANTPSIKGSPRSNTPTVVVVNNGNGIENSLTTNDVVSEKIKVDDRRKKIRVRSWFCTVL